MADKLMIVLVNADPSEPAELGPPLFQATVAAAMEYEVEIIITGRSAELARRGIAEQLRLPDAPQTVYGLMQDAHRAGVVFKVCAPAPGLDKNMQQIEDMGLMVRNNLRDDPEAPIELEGVGLAQPRGERGDRARQAQGTGAHALGCLPFAVMGMVYLSTPAYISIIWTDKLGQFMLFGAALWMSCGVFVMKKMIAFKY